MEHFELTFRFDDVEQSMTRFNGLSIAQLSKFLSALSKMQPDNGEDLVLSEVKGNCYAPVISTTSRTQYEQIKSLHGALAKREYNSLKSSEKYYAKVLNEIVTKGIVLNVYDSKKDFYKTIDFIGDTNKYNHYYSTNSKKGYLTKIGSKNFDSKVTVFVSNYPYEIEIDKQQESLLNAYYKNSLIEFYFTEKINKANLKVEGAVLDSFEVMNQPDFYDSITAFRDKYGTYFNTISLDENNQDE